MQSLSTGWFLPIFFLTLLLASYSISVVANNGRLATKLNFLVADRQIGWIASSFSVAAAWTWATGMFVSAQKAYLEGWVGLFWFTVPNVLCLVLFAFFAQRIREMRPSGFTLSDLMRDTYSERVQNLYWLGLIGLTVCAFAVQLLAGGKLLSVIAGWDFMFSVILLSILPLSYSLIFGLRSSIFTDFVKMALMLLGFVLLIPVLFANVGLDTILAGFSGVKKDIGGLFDARGLEILIAFGVPATIGLLAGPFGDQAFWQRAFAMEDPRYIKRSFIAGGLIFGLVPIGMALFGWAAAGSGFKPKDPQMVNIEFILANLPFWCSMVFIAMVLSGIVSILDSKMCSISSIAGHDVKERYLAQGGEKLEIGFSRMSMVFLTLAALLIALIPGLQLLHLFLFYGTLRAATFMPTVYTLATRGKAATERSVFWGIALSMLSGLPLFAWATLTKQPMLALAASIGTMLLPLIVILMDKAKRQ
jgi:Na+/proline symporter